MPKVKTLQIVWHAKEPVYSCDFHLDGTLYTAGADKEIKSWEVSSARLLFSFDHSSCGSFQNFKIFISNKRRFPWKKMDMLLSNTYLP
jgi:hypothetical protein